MATEETLGKLIHPNVVPVHSVHNDPETGMSAVCMPYLGSSTLADVLDVSLPPDAGEDSCNVLPALRDCSRAQKRLDRINRIYRILTH